MISSCGWGQGNLHEKYEWRRGREAQMSTCRLRVQACRKSALLTHPSDSVKLDTFGDVDSGQGRRAAPLWCGGDILGDECWRGDKHLRFPSRSSRRHVVVEQIYGPVQAVRCLFNVLCNKFEQSEADRLVHCKFDNGEVEMVVFLHMDDIIALVQATMERFAAELGEKFKVMSRVEKFGVENASRTLAFGGGVNPLSKWMSRKLRRRRKIC